MENARQAGGRRNNSRLEKYVSRLYNFIIINNSRITASAAGESVLLLSCCCGFAKGGAYIWKRKEKSESVFLQRE